MRRRCNDNSERPKALVRGSKKTRYYQVDQLDLVAELRRVAKPEGVMSWMMTTSGWVNNTMTVRLRSHQWTRSKTQPPPGRELAILVSAWPHKAHQGH